MTNKITMIPMIDAGDLPTEVTEWCNDNEIPTHCDDGIPCFLSDERNPLMNWLREQGFNPTGKYQYIGVKGT